MHAAWFTLLALMLSTYVVLDGFDFGAGAVHLWVARTDQERRTVLAAIGPLWDGNEVWLIAAGGSFFFAFPRAYAAAFSGLYLPLMMVLWLLILRGAAIELRSLSDNPLWRAAWDATFAGASATMAVVLGVALGNVVRGVPVDAAGYFQEDLFASVGGPRAGAIDLLTLVYGVLALATLAAHGSTFLVWKTEGAVAGRARRLARWLWTITLALGLLATGLTALLCPAFFAHLRERPWLLPLPLVATASAVVAFRSLGAAHELRAFLASSAFIAAMLLSTAGVMYPVILRSTLDEAFTLDAHNAASSAHGLVTGLLVCLPAIALAIGYFSYLFRSFRGKASGGAHDR